MLGIFLVIVMTVFGLSRISSYGAEEIKRIQLTIRSAPDEESGFLCESRGNAAYQVDEVNLISGFEVDSPGPGTDGLSFEEIQQRVLEGREKVLEIVLQAKEGASFGTLKETDIVLKGLGGSCSRATRKEGRQELVLEVAVNEPKKHRKIEDAEWQGNSCGIGTWTAADRDSVYRVFLYRDDKIVGIEHRTSGLQFDFSALMAEPGTYRFLVQALDEKEEVYTSQKSPYMYFNGFTENTVKKSSEKTSGTQWEDTVFYDEDGVPIQNNWFHDTIADRWYFCDGQGRMKQNTWFLWKGKPYMVDKEGVWYTETVEM